MQRLADRLAAWLIYLALAGAAITYLVTRDLTATIAAVVVAGARGVAAGTPLAVLVMIARIARNQVPSSRTGAPEALSARHDRVRQDRNPHRRHPRRRRRPC